LAPLIDCPPAALRVQGPHRGDSSRWGVLLFLIALIPGIVGLIYQSGIGFGPGNEMAALARNLAEKGYYGNPFEPFETGPSALVPPLYPLFLAALFKNFGLVGGVLISDGLCIIVNALIASLMPRLSAMLCGDRRPGIFAGALWIVSCRLLPNWDMSYTIAGTVVLCLLTRRTCERGETALWGAVAGVSSGLLLLLNPATLLVIAPWFAWLLFDRRIPLRRAVPYAVTTALAVGLCILPWVLRNYRIWGVPVLRTSFGVTLHLSNNDCAESSLSRELANGCFASTFPRGTALEAGLVRTLGEAEYDRRKKAQAIAWIRAHFGRFSQLTVQRVVEFWFPEPVGLLYPTYAVWLVTVLSVPGLFWMLRRKEQVTWFIVAVWLFYPLMYYVMVSGDRYRYPILWTSLLPAGYLLARIFPGHDRAHRRSVA
jgi:hypothetical protein